MICFSVNRLFLIVDLLSIDSTIRWREFRGAGQSGDLLLGIGVPLLCVYIQGYFEFEFLEPIVQYMFALHLGMVAGLAHRKPQARDIPPRLRAGSHVAPQMP
jgi:hypothetical protein